MQNNIPDTTNMNAGQLANQAFQAANSPDMQSAQGAVNTANTAYQGQLGENYTLPQLLSNSLNQNLDNPNDPNRQQTQTDLGSLLSAVSNPSNAISQAENIVPGAILSPGAQNQAMAEDIGRKGAALSMDNMILGARGSGISNIIDMYSKHMASRTQQLLAGVQAAQSNRDFLWQKAQGLGQLAMSAAQLKQGQQQFEESLAFQQKTSPLLQAKASLENMKADVGSNKNMSFDEFMSRYENDPALAGMTNDQKYNQYLNSGGKGQLSNQDLVKYGIKTGNIAQQWGAYLQSFMSPQVIGTAVGGTALGLGGLAAKLGLLKGVTKGASWLGGLVNKGGQAVEALAPELEAVAESIPPL